MPSISCEGRPRVARLLVLSLALILLESTAQAYTVVLRGGRVVEIPSTFTVTATTVTYEVSAGLQVTLQLAAIDIPATERANRERAGSLLTRIQKEHALAVQESAAKGNQARSRSITNRDLEPFARTRRERELAYEHRRQELGLPSLEESRQRAIAEAASIRERFEQSQLEEEVSEAYWRERANVLKTEIEVIQGEIDSLQRQITLVAYPNGLASIAVLTGAARSPRFGRSAVSPALRSPLSPLGVFVAPQRGPQLDQRIRSGSETSRGQVFANPATIPRLGAPGVIAQPFVFVQSIAPFGFYPFDSSYERAVLITRLHELVTTRAGLEVRWRTLEDEARRAGVFPGWLR